MTADTESTATEITESSAPVADSSVGRRRPRLFTVIASVVTVLALAAAIAFAAVEFYHHHQNDAVSQARSEVVGAASTQAIAMLSYQHDTVDAQLAAAADGLTGDFKDKYTSLIQQTVAPAAKEKSIDTTVSVVGSSIVDATGDSATVMLFLNQVTTTVDTPDPSTSGSRVKIDLDKVDGRWLVSDLAPI